MHDSINIKTPPYYQQCKQKIEELGFTMPSDMLVGTLLRTLVASKRQASVLELGTGLGLSLAWILDGMDPTSNMITIDNDQTLISEVQTIFSEEKNVTIRCEDAGTWIENYTEAPFDFIFADTWAGKYTHLDAALALLKIGGLYLVDDMSEQTNWPDGHAEKAKFLISTLEKREDMAITKLDWSTGIVIATKLF